MRVFKTPTQITISVDERNRRSVLELTAGDRPGLLCDVGKVLWEERVELHAAKISTLGERAEDVFYVTDRSHRPLDEATAERWSASDSRRSINGLVMNPNLARLHAYPFERLRHCSRTDTAGAAGRASRCRSVSPSTSRRRS